MCLLSRGRRRWSAKRGVSDGVAEAATTAYTVMPAALLWRRALGSRLWTRDMSDACLGMLLGACDVHSTTAVTFVCVVFGVAVLC